MNKDFDDCFLKLQAEMVTKCLEYFSKKVQKLFIYSCCVGGNTLNDLFYKEEYDLFKHEALDDNIEDCIGEHQLVVNRGNMVLGIINSYIEKIHQLSIECNKDIPVEIKLEYDAKKCNLDMKYEYDDYFNDKQYQEAKDFIIQWFKEKKAESDFFMEKNKKYREIIQYKGKVEANIYVKYIGDTSEPWTFEQEVEHS